MCLTSVPRGVLPLSVPLVRVFAGACVCTCMRMWQTDSLNEDAYVYDDVTYVYDDVTYVYDDMWQTDSLNEDVYVTDRFTECRCVCVFTTVCLYYCMSLLLYVTDRFTEWRCMLHGVLLLVSVERNREKEYVREREREREGERESVCVCIFLYEYDRQICPSIAGMEWETVLQYSV